jgi:hypothetical protein
LSYLYRIRARVGLEPTTKGLKARYSLDQPGQNYVDKKEEECP